MEQCWDTTVKCYAISRPYLNVSSIIFTINPNWYKLVRLFHVTVFYLL